MQGAHGSSSSNGSSSVSNRGKSGSGIAWGNIQKEGWGNIQKEAMQQAGSSAVSCHTCELSCDRAAGMLQLPLHSWYSPPSISHDHLRTQYTSLPIDLRGQLMLGPSQAGPRAPACAAQRNPRVTTTHSSATHLKFDTSTWVAGNGLGLPSGIRIAPGSTLPKVMLMKVLSLGTWVCAGCDRRMSA